MALALLVLGRRSLCSRGLLSSRGCSSGSSSRCRGSVATGSSTAVVLAAAAAAVVRVGVAVGLVVVGGAVLVAATRVHGIALTHVTTLHARVRHTWHGRVHGHGHTGHAHGPLARGARHAWHGHGTHGVHGVGIASHGCLLLLLHGGVTARHAPRSHRIRVRAWWHAIAIAWHCSGRVHGPRRHSAWHAWVGHTTHGHAVAGHGHAIRAHPALHVLVHAGLLAGGAASGRGGHGPGCAACVVATGRIGGRRGWRVGALLATCRRAGGRCGWWH
mmetsp:Transcript_25713/g.65344  ORF Transcript_25713/g.65344 Transcript_25713/m.65344 type:complete len:273 (-) Transcript_25713:1099-1917(-)